MQNWINSIFQKIQNDLTKLDFNQFKPKYESNYQLAHKKLKIENNEPKLSEKDIDFSEILENINEVKNFCLDMEFNKEMTIEFVEANCYITLTTMVELSNEKLENYLKELKN